MIYLSYWKHCISALLKVVLIIYPFSAFCFTLDDAIILAHENNNKVLSEFQNYNAARMSKPKAYAGFLPSVNLNNSNNHQEFTVPSVKNQLGSPYYRQYGMTVNQPIFSGGGTYAQVKIADNTVASGLAQFHDVSSSITLDAVRAYEGVLRTREVYDINIKNEQIFEQYLEFTKIRFEAGVITRTDVLQAEVRLSDAKAQRETAYASMRNSEANFEHIIGIHPSKEMDPIVTNNISVPTTIDELIVAAKDNNPTLKAATYNAKAAKYQVNASVAQVLPTVSANATVTRITDAALAGSNSNNTYTLQVNVPIFQGGKEFADIAEKKYKARKADFDRREVEDQLVENAISVWNNNKTSKSVIKARWDSIVAAEEALTGVKEEVTVGTRTTIDLLNAESELFNARVTHRNAQSELVISIYQMLQLIGQIDPIGLDYNNNG
jgi:TolC family type I secretion outer membrane protein